MSLSICSRFVETKDLTFISREDCSVGEVVRCFTCVHFRNEISDNSRRWSMSL